MSKEIFEAVAEMATGGRTTLLRGLLSGGEVDGARREVVRTAAFHLVNGFVGAALAEQPVNDEVLERHFASCQQAATFHHLRTMADLTMLNRVLDGADIGWAVLKGPFLVEHAYKRVDVRSYTDLDVLVDRHRFGDVLDALEAAGASLSDRNWPMIAATQRGELSLVLPHARPSLAFDC
jgi:hypothetical protein